MSKSKGILKMWFPALLAVTLLAGCGDSNGGYDGNGGAAVNSDKAVTAYSLAGSTGSIDETSKTIAVTMPYATDVKALVATFATTGGGVTVGGVPQTSGTTANNFSAPVTYAVAATDGSTEAYTVTVAVAPITGRAVTSFTVAGVTGTVDESARTISVILPNGTDLTTLVPTFTTTGAAVTVAGAPQTSGSTVIDGTSPLLYTVTAADGSKSTYTVNVSAASTAEKAITAYSLAGVGGTVNESANTISVIMPNGTSVTGLVATFTTTGATVKVGTAVQASGVTANSFPVPVIYTVTAADGTSRIYTVTVTVAASAAKDVTAYSLAGVTGTLNTTEKTIAVTLPSGTDATALVATFTTTGASVKVATTLQKSGTTTNNFTAPVAYLVTAADGTTATYTVTGNCIYPQYLVDHPRIGYTLQQSRYNLRRSI